MKILDKGRIRLVRHAASDDYIVQAARVSYGKGTKTKLEDDKLIDYLLRNEHGTPFEMCSFVFHVKCPIFVARQWFRHRSGSFNEVSARYSEMENEFYVPELNRIQGQSPKNKQCSGDVLSEANQFIAQKLISSANKKAYRDYKKLLKLGVARELARTILPVSLYTEFYWGIDLRNLLKFIELRSHPHAQPEIQEYAKAIKELIKDIVPATIKSYDTRPSNQKN